MLLQDSNFERLLDPQYASAKAHEAATQMHQHSIMQMQQQPA